MRKNTKKAVCILFAVLLLVCSFPISAFAVDPVSASVIANSFAQAITAYGASHGVSMTFDGIESGNTAQIGERVHELWSKFREGQQTADDYDTIAAAVFPGLYNKVVKAGGTAVVGMSIAQQYMPDIDGFWNWLLSGPAEMVKVDNAYQWNTNPATGVIDPVTVLGLPSLNGFEVAATPFRSGPLYSGSSSYREFRPGNSSYPTFAYLCVYNGNYQLVFISKARPVLKYWTSYDSPSSVTTVQGDKDAGSAYYVAYSNYINGLNSILPAYSVSNNSYIPSSVFGADTTMSVEDKSAISVQPYVGDAVAKPVPLPDVGAPDYGPVTWTGDLDVPWNDTLFGDGTGTLTDAQKGAITQELDGVIENDGTLTLEGDKTAPGPDEGEDDPPSDDPDDYGVIGLENIFPFCIPFDIYNFLNALAATPTAPRFTATLQLPAALGGAQTIVLDFDNPTFNQLAQLLRLLELLAFIVGLALLTRSMFIRG